MKPKSFLVVSSLFVVGIVGFAALGAEHPRERQVKDASTDPGVGISDEELMDMLYANERSAPQGPNEDGSIPLTFNILTEIALFPFPIPADRGALSPSESLDTQESDDSLSIPLSPEQVTELKFFRETTVTRSMLPASLQVAMVALNTNGAELAPSGEIGYAGEPAEQQVGEGMGFAQAGNLLGTACRFHVVCDDAGNCELRCGGSCPKKKSCATVTRQGPGGGSDTTCEWVALEPVQ